VQTDITPLLLVDCYLVQISSHYLYYMYSSPTLLHIVVPLALLWCVHWVLLHNCLHVFFIAITVIMVLHTSLMSTLDAFDA